jgi:hypothetical protein
VKVIEKCGTLSMNIIWYSRMRVAKAGMVACTCIVSALRRLRQEDHEFKACMGYIWRLSQKPIMIASMACR